MGEYYKIITEEDHLEHYGVKGMKWDLKFRKHLDSFYKRAKRRVRGTADNVINSMAKAYDKEYGEQESRTYNTNPKTGKYEIMNKGWANSDKAKRYAMNKARDAHYAVTDAARTTVKYGKKVGSNILKSIGKIKIPKLITEERTFK